MERFETDAVADAHGVVHIRVGHPGERVHVAVKPVANELPLSQVDMLRSRLAANVWPDVPASLIGRSWTDEERDSLLGIDA
jgi:hypothetical protein